MDSKGQLDSGWAGVKETDVERHAHDTSYLNNRLLKSLSWNDVSVTVRDRGTKKPRKVLSWISGHVVAGELFSKRSSRAAVDKAQVR